MIRRSIVSALSIPMIAVALVPFAPASPPNLQQAADDYAVHAIEALIRSEEAEAKKQRMLLIQAAVKLAEQDKQQAKSERERLESRRARLDHLIGVRQWALGYFEPERGSVLPTLEHVPSTLKRWQHARDTAKRVLLEFPDRSRGAVKSGRALNFFLDICGGVALDHQLCGDQLRDQLKSLEMQRDALRDVIASRSGNGDAAALELRSVEALHAELKFRESLLARLIGSAVLTGDQRRHIRFEQGVTGGKLVVSNSDGPLPLEWPSLLRSNPEYESHLAAMEAAKAAALTELKQNHGISPGTQQSMLDAADAIFATYQQDRLTWMEGIKAGLDTAHRFDQYNAAQHFIRGLRAGVCRFVEARHLRDVAADKPFEGTTAGELLAYAARNGYRFAPPDRNGEGAYLVIYQQMVDYYCDLSSLRLAIEADQRELAKLDDKIETLFDIQYRDTMKTMIEALKAQPERDLAAKFRDYSSGFSNMFGVINTVFGDGGGPGPGMQVAGGAPPDARGYRIGDRVMGTAGLVHRWSGVIQGVSGASYRIKILRADPATGYHKGETYDFLPNEFSPYRMRVGNAIDFLINPGG